MKTRAEIITSMCMTYRHDYGLTRHPTDFPFTAGMLDTERQALWNQMAQIFDNVILPCMNFKECTENERTNSTTC